MLAPTRSRPTAALLFPALHGAAAAVGLVGLFCSAMIYIDTRRVFWRAAQTLSRFGGAVVALGAAAALAVGFARGASAVGLIAVTLVKLTLDWNVAGPGSREVSGRLLRGPLRRALVGRQTLAAAGALPSEAAWVGLAAVLAGEFMERQLFFRAVDAPKMPGMPA